MKPNVNKRPGIKEKTVNLMGTSTPEIEEKSVDLLSVTSDDYKDDDEISFDEGRLQQWNCSEFQKQLWGAASGIVIILCCEIISAWAICDFIKDIQVNEAEWVDLDYNFELFDSDGDDILSSRHVIIAMVVLAYNLGIIIGAIFGAFVIPLLPNRAIYVNIYLSIFSLNYTVIQSIRFFYRLLDRCACFLRVLRLRSTRHHFIVPKRDWWLDLFMV